MMGRITIALFLTAALFACDQKDDVVPDPEATKQAELKILSGDNQQGATASFLEDTLIVQIIPVDTSLHPERFYLLPHQEEGRYLSFSYQHNSLAIKFNSDGIIKMAWELGCAQTQQSLKLYLYHEDSCAMYDAVEGLCDPFDSVTFSAKAHALSGWNRACGIVHVDRYNTKLRSFGDQTYAINYGKLYRARGGESLFWEEIETSIADNLYDLGFTSSGDAYILTSNTGVYYSADLKTWSSISDGILDMRYPMALLVEDSVVFASFHFDGLYRYRSGTNFWRKLLINGSYSEEYEFPVRHPNGDIYVADKWRNVWVSENSGDLWSKAPIGHQYINYELEDLKIHPSGIMCIGSGDATLALISPDSYTGDTYRYYEWNASTQDVNNIFFRGNDIYYLVNSTPNPGIYSSASNWQKMDVKFEKRINLFHYDLAGNLYLGSNDGIYYWIE